MGLEETQGAEKARSSWRAIRRSGFAYQLAVAVAILVGLFFVEYPPIFVLGYWSWGGLVHKTITGVLLAVNLIITQYSAKRLGLFKGASRAERPKPRSQATGAV